MFLHIICLLFLLPTFLLSCQTLSKSEKDRNISSEKKIEQKQAIIKQWVLGVSPCKNTGSPDEFVAVARVCNLKRVWLVEDGTFWEKDKLIPGTIKEVYEVNTLPLFGYATNQESNTLALARCESKVIEYKEKLSSINPCKN